MSSSSVLSQAAVSGVSHGAGVTYCSSGIAVWASGADGAVGGAMEGLFACKAGARGAAPVADLGVAAGLDVVVRVEEARGARGVARAVSAVGREVVRGRLGAGAGACEGAMVDLLSETGALPGDDRVASVEVLRAAALAGFLFSSPDVSAAMSGSASEAPDLDEASPVLLAAVPGAGRVGGLFKLDPTVLARVVELESGFDAVVEPLAVDAAAGRLAARPAELAVPRRRGGTASALEAAEDVEDAILRRAAVGDAPWRLFAAGAAAGAGASEVAASGRASPCSDGVWSDMAAAGASYSCCCCWARAGAGDNSKLQ
ncbi:hypothetical protein P154DRAFT_48407 [Amniculicola lignicola CBS 123094]|uniref:Uncharacterized protein n=1 Tax=Amniculicola lignicola CBS 123094 TaxID=1392246 RepID=A0A6A5VYE5_9PLEO|nr:hypothetical protein P154DRAFT_48407 [Amniculicola lignicola CBS 123094]